jgi:hypothetical protein
MGGGAGVEVRAGRRLLCEVGREPLVEEDDRDVEELPQTRGELLAVGPDRRRRSALPRSRAP